ncbi:MAG: nucleotidyltransferase domain-containing protein [Nanoarchaeota archaeon]|nr:nucleotidyltransferase domain-containing protein [Nanoarchaeota archaeon]
MAKRIKSENMVLNEAYQKTIQWFFAYPERVIGLNDLSGELGISKATAKRVVSILNKEEFLNVEVLGRLWRIRCNKEHYFNHTLKISSNLANIYTSSVIRAVHQAVPNAKAIILFGSYRKGDDIDASDVDIAAEIVGNEPPKIIELGVLEHLGFRKNVTVNLYVFSRNNIDINLFANIANGIVLEGFLETRP